MESWFVNVKISLTDFSIIEICLKRNELLLSVSCTTVDNVSAKASMMKKFGIYLVIGGIGSGILSFFGYNFKLLMWVNFWGDTTAWLIRVAIVLVGGLLVAIGSKSPVANANLKA